MKNQEILIDDDMAKIVWIAAFFLLYILVMKQLYAFVYKIFMKIIVMQNSRQSSADILYNVYTDTKQINE